MVGLNSLGLDERFLATGDEAGTAPDDRRFRPDVEGLRAVAVLLVVFYHANVAWVTGGFVGVDVFFVISGFVITGLLLREHRGTGRTSILNFYARRVRRILPAATLVILVVVSASYLVLGYVSGNTVADDGRWAAVFLSNFHFEAVGTNYFTAKLPPSPLQNFWSLSVEEQFYVVYPTLFLVMARLKGRLSLQVKMAIVLGLVIVSSYWLSVVQTASQPTAAYFSPFTRAWELALGALVAVATPWLKRIPAPGAALLTWAGLAAIAVAAFTFTAETPYPGSLVAIPVLGAALVIAGGVAAPRLGAEQLLKLRAFQWFGKRSYSLYLWHWPILIIAAEQAGKTSLSLRDNLALILLAIVVSMASYRLVENPIRHWKLPSRTSVAAGITTVVATLAILSLMIGLESTSGVATGIPAAPNLQAVLHEVAAAKSITKVPATIDPGLAQAASDYGGYFEDGPCEADFTQSTEKLCFLGDVHAHRLLIVYGDSHAVMWLSAFDSIAKDAHMRLLILGKPSCPAEPIVVANPLGLGSPGAPDVACNNWHKWAVRTINRLSPSILVVSQENTYMAPGLKWFTHSQWANGLAELFKMIQNSRTEKIFLGNIPLLAQTGPTCLSAHLADARACSTPVAQAYLRFDQTEFSVTESLDIRYIDPTPWFCSSVCTAIVGPYNVYLDRSHVTAAYASYVHNALAQALFSPSPMPTRFKVEISVSVARPSNGATVSGAYVLAGAAVLGSSPVTKVEFRLSGGQLDNQLIGVANKTFVGWLCYWNTSNVANGRYTLRSIAYDAAGKSVQSKPISLSVKN
jgi:peptidoglycan/LPS O-acetylase OafA/YrhL